METGHENKWIYFGVFLNDDSKKKLYNAFKDQIPEGWTVYCHHMTVAFNRHDSRSDELHRMYNNSFGSDVSLDVISLGISKRAIAAQVSFYGETGNDVAHITVATAPDAKPVESNYIEKWDFVDEPFTLTGTMKEFCKK